MIKIKIIMIMIHKINKILQRDKNMDKEKLAAKLKMLPLYIIIYLIYFIILGETSIMVKQMTFIPFCITLCFLNFYCWGGYKLIFKYLFKTKICIDNELAALKYILIPILLIETGVFICYPDETFQALSLYTEDSK